MSTLSAKVMSKYSSLFVITFGLAAGAAQANLLTNGSFESPVVPAGTFVNFSSGSVGITGWTATGPAGTNVSVVSRTYTVSGLTLPAENGSQWLDLTGDNSNSVEGISQTVVTVPGKTYTLTFWVGNASPPNVGATSSVGLKINGSPAGNYTNSTPGTTMNWKKFTYAFISTSSITAVEFDNLDPTSDDGNGLDNVDLEERGTAMPLPVNILINGDFEAPAVPAGTGVDVNSGSTNIYGWTVVGTATRTVALVNGALIAAGIRFPAEDGHQWLDLAGTFVAGGTRGITQTVATIAGRSYRLTFWVGNVFDPGGSFGTTSAVGLKINGKEAGTFTNSTQAITVNWRQFSATFTAVGDSTTIEFDNLDPPGDDSNGLDNVVLQQIGSTSDGMVFTYVAIPTSDNLQSRLINTFPTGTFIANNALETPFRISFAPGNCGISGTSTCNYYDGFGASGNGKSITMDVSIASPTDVYTLINAYSPPPGRQLATIQFLGTGGTSLSFPLIGGKDIRDYYQGVFANSLTNGISGVTALNAFWCNDPTGCLGSGGTGNVQTGHAGNYVVDEQHFSLGATFAGKTLTEIVITDTNNGSTPILLGITVGSKSAGIPTVASGGVVTASAFGEFTSVSPGSWIEIYGSNFATNTRSWGGPDFDGVNAPTSLDGTSVTIGGQAAFVDFISPGQVNAQVPANVGTGLQQITLQTPAGTSNPLSITVNALEPGLLAPASFNLKGAQYVAAVFSDGTYVLPEGAIPGRDSRPAKAGDTIVLYGVGFGPVTPDMPAGQIVEQANKLASSFQVSIGGMPATVKYAGLAPGAIGLYQFNVVVPDVGDDGAAPLTFTLGSDTGAQTLYIPVQN